MKKEENKLSVFEFLGLQIQAFVLGALTVMAVLYALVCAYGRC